jgi:hypothetical protein
MNFFRTHLLDREKTDKPMIAQKSKNDPFLFVVASVWLVSLALLFAYTYPP